MCKLVSSIMIATEGRWRSIYKARCCWRLSPCGLQMKLLRLLHYPYHIKLNMWKFLQVLAGRMRSAVRTLLTLALEFEIKNFF